MQVSLLSPAFLALSVTAILLLGLLRGAARQAAFLAINLVFVAGLVLGWVGAVSSVSFVLFGYLLIQLTRRYAGVGLGAGVVVFTVVFVYMRRYDFLEWILPDALLTRALATAGLSFLFFKILHVMIEARSDTLGRFDFPTYLNYCLNFTTFTMGPIQRYQDYREQWDGERPAIALNFEAHLDALLRVLRGLVKVYVLAAWLLPKALSPDENLLQLSLPGLLVRCYAFWFYLYFNFSGYCDVVIGVGSLMGVRPPENFNMPFLARNISDFWLRQHRSLTLWLTDYVFTPSYKAALSRSRSAGHPLASAVACLMLTMLVSGLWHGTTLSFLLFGIVHGLWFVIYRIWDHLMTKWLGRRGLREWRQRRWVHATGVVLTFNATAFAFIFFQMRPDSLIAALRGMLE
jgi:D-alanyl-lipoteichoic acid acyltransferase DltB (MBOAT superfamily)